MGRAPTVLCLVQVLTAALAPLPVAAQTNLETNAGIQFNFSTPGAANLALGGAFLALAFDGTAAYTNPAGLAHVLDREVWLEARHWRYTHVFTDRGRIAGVDPVFGPPDDVPGLRPGEATSAVSGPSFASYVHPGDGWTLALYQHKLLDFEADFQTRGAFLEPTRGRSPVGIPGANEGRLAALSNRVDTEIDSYGVAGAYRLGPSLSVGASLWYSGFRIDSRADRFVPRLVADPPFQDPDRRVNTQTQRGTDDDWSYTVGALWRSPDGTWSAGGVYRRGPGFRFSTRSERGPGTSLEFPTVEREALFHVPDVYGIGIAWRPTDRLTVALDYDRVEYSDLLDDVVDVFGLDTLFPGRDPELDRFRIDDVGEIHLGAELWLALRDRAVSVRLGGWYEPDHNLRFDGENVGYGAVFRGGSDAVHVTGGVGLALPRVQVDVGVDHAERLTVVSLSAGTRF